MRFSDGERTDFHDFWSSEVGLRLLWKSVRMQVFLFVRDQRLSVCMSIDERKGHMR